MLHRFWLGFITIAATPFALAALEEVPEADPSSLTAPVPSFQYKSAIESYLPIVEDDVAPDKRWRAANEEVARIGGHAGYMKAEGASSHASHQHAPPAAQPAATETSHESGHHGKHHGHNHGSYIDWWK